MSLHNYQRVQNQTEDPRKTEYRLFALVTKALMDAETSDRTSLVKAIHWNRRLWLTLQADCSVEENRLPEATRAGIISLAIWVDKHSRKVLKGEGQLKALVDVNRSIMEGLAA